MNSLFLGNHSLFVNGTRLSAIDSAPGPTPPSLPPYTIRLKFTEGVTPSFGSVTLVQVSSSPNIWDLTYENASWYRLFRNQTNLLEVIGANTTGVTNMSNMFYNCSALTTVPLFDTSSATNLNYMFYGCTGLTSIPLFNTSSATNLSYMFFGCTGITTVPLFNTSSVINMGYMFRDCSGLTSIPLFNTSSATNMSYMFYNCSGLTTVPLFNTSSVTNMNSMFYNCTNVQSGALAIYQQASSQATPPSRHTHTFTNCGSNTTTGAAELAQIPDEWK